MPTRIFSKELLKEEKYIQKNELADAHCHLDLLDSEIIKKAVEFGVLTIIGDGVDTKSNMKTLELADNLNVFAALGIDPEHSSIDDKELEFNISLIKENCDKIVAIGEVGLDYKIAVTDEVRTQQKKVFGSMLDAANELNLPVSIHCRDIELRTSAFDDILAMLDEKKVKKAHFHFFDGQESQAKKIAERGYFISVPPIRSSKRMRVIRSMPIEMIMTESDAPASGKLITDTNASVNFIAVSKGMDYEIAREAVVRNTKSFFEINRKIKHEFMRR